MQARALGACLLLLACSRAEPDEASQTRHADDPPEAGDGEPDYAIPDFCADLRADWIARCEGWQQEDCETRSHAAFGAEVCAAAERAVEAGRVRYDAARAKRCVSRGAFDLAATWQSGWVEPLSCDGMFIGTALLGEACYPDETFQRVCREGYCEENGECPGRCTPYAEVGEHCVPERCAPGDYCSLDNECRPAIAVGESCPEGGGCASPASCVMGVCRYLADLGEPCGERTPCVSPLLCAQGACAAGVGPGEPCEVDRHCPDGYACGFVPLGGNGRSCLEPPDLGARCDVRAGCAPGARCAPDESPLVGRCESAPDAGAPEPNPDPAEPPVRGPSCIGQ